MDVIWRKPARHQAGLCCRWTLLRIWVPLGSHLKRASRQLRVTSYRRDRPLAVAGLFASGPTACEGDPACGQTLRECHLATLVDIFDVVHWQL